MFSCVCVSVIVYNRLRGSEASCDVRRVASGGRLSDSVTSDLTIRAFKSSDTVGRLHNLLRTQSFMAKESNDMMTEYMELLLRAY